MTDNEYEEDDFMYDEREEDEWPFGIPHDVLMELIGKDG